MQPPANRGQFERVVVSEGAHHRRRSRMTAEQAVAQYYDAWRTRRGDMSGVPLAEDFRFVGPVASFETAEGFREMAGQAGQAVTSFNVRRQFVDGNVVCSIVTARWRCQVS